MNERARFVHAYQSGMYSMTELCQRFGVSRKTGYKWLNRFEEASYDGLKDRSRAPVTTPHAMPEAMQKMILEARRSHPDWGPRKLIVVLKKDHPRISFPAASTVGDLLKRHGLVKSHKVKRRTNHPGAPAFVASAPNEVWTTDYKGEFLLGNGRYCYPLTVCDGYSRYILACEAQYSTESRPAQQVFRQLFEEFGLPVAIRSDNGSPFVSRAIHGLSRLNIFWMKLGIRHDRIAPASPQQNGRHERMHRTLKAATTRPPEATLVAQQRRFDGFRSEFNQERPHEALAFDTPGQHYHPSNRPMPKRIEPPEYPGHFELRRVSHAGCFKFRSQVLFLSATLVGERIGLEEVDDGVWNLFFYNTLLARYNERTGTIIP